MDGFEGDHVPELQLAIVCGFAAADDFYHPLLCSSRGPLMHVHVASEVEASLGWGADQGFHYDSGHVEIDGWRLTIGGKGFPSLVAWAFQRQPNRCGEDFNAESQRNRGDVCFG